MTCSGFTGYSLGDNWSLIVDATNDLVTLFYSSSLATTLSLSLFWERREHSFFFLYKLSTSIISFYSFPIPHEREREKETHDFHKVDRVSELCQLAELFIRTVKYFSVNQLVYPGWILRRLCNQRRSSVLFFFFFGYDIPIFIMIVPLLIGGFCFLLCKYILECFWIFISYLLLRKFEIIITYIYLWLSVETFFFKAFLLFCFFLF